jgi:cell division protein FtsI/penicillin-binding protein 2
MSVLVNPPYSLPDAGAGPLDSLWYDETWDPVYSGLKFRYFKKKFTLKEVPSSAAWKIFVSGDYSLRVNRRIVETPGDFVRALKKGENELTVLVARKGYRKNFYTDYQLKAENNRLLLKQAQVERTSFSKIKVTRKPLVSDMTYIPLAYNAEVNGRWQRFYASRVPGELLSFFGSAGEGVWGLEQIFSRLTPEEDRVSDVQLTINREWQSIVLGAMKKTLEANKESEINDPEYQALKKSLAAAEVRLQAKRLELTLSETAVRQSVMQDVISLQTEIEEIKKEINKVKNYFYEAAVVLMGPKGEILTAASYPYNDETMKVLNPDIAKPYLPRENPYLNRSWAWKYNPGSTAKILDSIAFLCAADREDEGGHYLFPYLRQLLTDARSFKNFPRLDLQDSFMLNEKEIVFRIRNFQGHVMPEGFCSLADAFAHSYNTYFSYLALHSNRVLALDSLAYGYENNQTDENDRKTFINKAGLPVAQMYMEYPTLEFAEKLMINRQIDLLYNLRGESFAAKLERAPNDSLMAIESNFPVNAYRAANVAHYAIGQGDFQVTALQNALIAAAVLNQGILYYPSLVQSVTLKDPAVSLPQEAKTITFDPERDKVQVFPESVAGQIKEAMKGVVERGTANSVFGEMREGRQFFAKTGTAETELYRDNSLFVGFVIFKDETPLVFSVIVPRAGLGAKVAGKLTEDILKALIEYENSKGRNW